MKKKNTTCFVAGRSGGHIVPALTLGQQIKNQDMHHTIMLFTAATSLDREIIAEHNNVVDIHIPLNLGNVPYKNVFIWPIFLYQCVITFCTSLYYLYKHKPREVISMGGYISLPVCLAAKILRIPIELFELNVELGQATNVLAKIATKISVCFEETKTYLPLYSCTIKPYPIRFNQQVEINQLRARFGVASDQRIILIIGGSQGSLFINTSIKQWLEIAMENPASWYIFHQIGGADSIVDWKERYKKCGIAADVFAYRHDIESLYAVADVIVCRSGAGSLFEALFFNKACITIPLETPTNTHQVANAYAMAKKYPELVTVFRQDELLKDSTLLGKELQRRCNAIL